MPGNSHAHASARRRAALTRRGFLGGGLAATAAFAGCRSSQPLTTASLGLKEFSADSAHGYPIHGIDVSKYQGDIAWDRVREANTAFAFLKATEGGDRLDDRFNENWKKAREAGVPRGAYHFWYHCRPGSEQAAWFIEQVPRERGALPPVIDVEWTPFSPTCTIRPPRADLVREVGSMARILEQHYGQKPVLYIPIDVHEDRLEGAFPDHDVWVRSTADHPEQTYNGRRFRFWQYTATGSVDGVRGEVDRNAFAGTETGWRRWLRANIHA